MRGLKKAIKAIYKYKLGIISLTLVLVLLVMGMPKTWIVAADEIRNREAAQTETEEEYVYEPDYSVETSDKEWEDKYIEFELEHKRDEFSKHYYMSDGSIVRETFAKSIHYKDENGEYRDIDNRLIEYTDGGVEKIANAGNDFKVEFLKVATNSDPLMSISKGEYTLKMYSMSIQEQKGVATNTEKAQKLVKAKIAQKDKFTASKEGISYKDKKLTESIKNKNLTSTLEFAEIQPGVDIAYTLEQKSVQESIKINSKQENNTLGFYIETDGLFLELLESGEIVGYNEENEEILIAPVPIMSDALGECGEVRNELIKLGEFKYIIEITPDEAWINAENRAYPIAIEPSIESYEASSILNVQMSEDTTEIKYTFRQGEVVFNRKLNLNLQGSVEVNKIIATDEGITSNIIQLSAGQSISFAESEAKFILNSSSSLQMATVSVSESYKDEMGIESSYGPLSYEGGDYTMYVKPRSNTYTIEIPYVTVQAPSMPIPVSAYYNPGFSGYRNVLYPSSKDYYGKDIKLNVEQYMIKQEYEDYIYYVYIDADGSSHIFVKTEENNEYYNSDLHYYYNASSKTVKDILDNEIMRFNSNGLLQTVNNQEGQSIVINYSNGNKIDYIENYVTYDDENNVYLPFQQLRFEYNNNNQLYGLVCGKTAMTIDDLTDPIQRINISYSSGKLTDINDYNNNKLVHAYYGDKDQISRIYNRYGVGHSFSVYQNGGMWSQVHKVALENGYDSYGYVLSRSTFAETNMIVNSYNDYGTFLGRYYYAYDLDGKIISESFDPDKGKYMPISTWAMYYDIDESKSKITKIEAEYETKNALELNGNSVQISASDLSNYRNPVLIGQAHTASDTTYYIYYKSGTKTIKSDPLFLTAQGTSTLLPLPKYNDLGGNTITVGIDSKDSNMDIEFFGIGELTSKTESTLYLKDSSSYSKGDSTVTVVTPEGTTVTENTKEKAVETYTNELGEKVEKEYKYKANTQVVEKQTTKVQNNGTVIYTETVDYKFEDCRNLVTQKTTTIEESSSNKKQYIEKYAYDPIGNMVKYTTNDNHVYDYVYTQWETTSDMLLKAVKLDNVIMETYGYNEGGKQISVTDNKGTITYLRDGNKFSGYEFGSMTYTYGMNGYGDITGISKNGTEVLSYTLSNSSDKVTYANGQFVQYDYNELGMLTSQTSSEQDVDYTYTYQNNGDLKSVEFGDVTKTYTQEGLYKYTETTTGEYNFTKTDTYSDSNYYMGSVYEADKFKRETSIKYKSYILGLIDSEDDSGYITKYTYNSKMQVETVTIYFDEKLLSKTEYIYDEETNRLSEYRVTVEDTTMSYKLEYDSRGNIVGIIQGSLRTVSYNYDSAGRLISENKIFTNDNYAYDKNNNIDYVEHKYSGNTTRTVYSNKEDRLVYDHATGQEFSYDENGNMLHNNTASFTWMQGNKLESASIDGEKYVYYYDENGIRYKKERYDTEGETLLGTTIYYLDGAKIIGEDREGAMISYYYNSSGVVGMLYNGSYYFFVKDVLGNITYIYTIGSTLASSYAYDAWGNYTIAGPTSSFTNVNPFKYRGYYQDSETGLYYLQTRYYDPDIRRFISPDNYGLIPYLANTGDLNLYAYCNNNPVMGYDPTGMWDWDTFWLGLGLAITATTAIVLSVTTFGAGIPIAMQIMAGVTLAAGILTGINGVATMIEAGTDYNFVRDGLFNDVLGLSDNAYNWYAGIAEGVAAIGSMILGVYHTTGQYKAAKYGQKFLGRGYEKASNNRWISRDGIRQMIFDDTHHILDGEITTNHYNLITHATDMRMGHSEIISKLHVFYELFRIWFK